MKRFLFKYFLFCTCWLTSSAMDAQNTNNTGYKQDLMAPSPNASALSKYGDVPVSPFSGTSSISIPLYELRGEQLKLPISLNYHSGGNKVDEVASSVGLGWSLNAGGVISRVVKGKADETLAGFGIIDFDPNDCAQVGMAADGTLDAQPDQFYFNVAGFSGKFYLENVNGVAKARLIPHQDIVLTMIEDNTCFQLIAPDGTKYLFKKLEYTSIRAYGSTPPSFPLTGFTTSWYLTQIVHLTGDVIDLNYIAAPMSYVQSMSSVLYLNKSPELRCGNGQTSNSVDVCDADGYLVSSISSKFEVIKFKYNHVRLDLFGGQNKALSGIEVYATPRYGQFLLKKYNLEYGYFENSVSEAPPSNYWEDTKRLKLMSVTEIGVNGEQETVNPPYRFEYLETNDYALPPRFSTRQDHWGYANRNSMPTLLPSIPGNGLAEHRNGADRSANEESTKAGMIKTVHYPTGGRTEFEFEAHQIYARADDIYFYDGVELDVKSVALSAITDHSIITRRSAVFNMEMMQFIRINTTLGNAQGIQDAAYMKILKIEGNQESVIAEGVISATNWTTEALYVPGNYQLEIRSLVPNIDATLSLTYNKIARRRDAVGNATIGGVRIKKIKNFDGINSTPIVKRYEYTNESLQSTGKLVSVPQYTDEVIMSTVSDCHQIILHTQSQAPLGTSEGSHIAYPKVTVYIGENGEGGKSEMYYTWAEDGLNYGFPFVQHNSNDWKRGHLEKEIDYKKNENGTYTAIKTVENSYLLDRQGPNTATKTGYAVAYFPLNRLTNLGCSSIFSEVRIRSYTITAPWVSLATSKVTQDGIVTETRYEYDEVNGNQTLPKAVVVTNSDGSQLRTETKYPKNLLGTPEVQALVDRNIIVPLEIRVRNNGVLLGGIKNTYQLKTVHSQLIPLPFEWRNILPDNSTIVRGTALSYRNDGFLTEVAQYGFAQHEFYTWDNGLLVEKAFGGLKKSFTYDPLTRQLTMGVDENGLKTRFYYDVFQRLQKTENRMKEDDTDVQATTEYAYQYKDANNPYNFVRTTSTFKGVSTPQITEAYSDGLGRTVGAMKQNYTPNGLHLKTSVSYDVLGRQEKAFLPFESGGLGYQQVLGGIPFVKTEYEASPLNRPLKQINVDNSTVLTAYSANGADEVWLFTGSNGSVSSNTRYAANTLFKTTMTDENGKQTVVFKDKLGRVILTRKFLNGQNVDTYNVYNHLGQLIAVLPPGSVDANGVVNVSGALTFQYKYDVKGRLIEKKIPGSEVQKFYYDARDLVVLMQDGNMRASNPQKHLATQYDVLGRVLKTGLILASPSAEQDYTAPISITNTERLTEIEYYPNKSWVKHQGARVLKPNGTYTPTDFVWSYVERRDALNYTGNPVWTGKQHLMYSGVSQDKINENTDWYGVDWSVTGVNGAQQPTMTIRYLNGDAAGVSDVRTWQEFAYDNGMRLTDQKYMYALNGDGWSDPSSTLANMVYNYKDQLIEKNIGYRGANQALQSIDYQYNTRGWLTGINTVGLSGGATSSLLTPSMQGTGTISQLAMTPYIHTAIQQQLVNAPPPMADNNDDLFSQTLTYENPDSRTGAAPQRNGNISSTVWQVAGRDRQAYGFKYDELNRLTEATYYDIVGPQSTFSADNKFSEKQTYDLRGNILLLQRNGLNGGSWTSNGYTAATYGRIDSLVYGYGVGNQLTQVRDYSLLDKGFKSVNNPNSTQYTYDKNGNLTSDLNKGILNIEYNVLNLPQVITFTENRQLQFVYDASGAKLRKMLLVNSVVTETRDYVNGVEYKDQVLQRVAHSEGAVVRNDFGQYQHEYVLRDHLGNVRVTFRDGVNRGLELEDPNGGPSNVGTDPTYDDGIVTKDDIVQINHFYPFGMNMEGDWNGAQGKNKYQFNGKEWNDDFGLGWNDYGARFYDPTLGRWHSVDPLAEKACDWTPYRYGFNNPVKFVDPTGMAEDWIPGVIEEEDENGKLRTKVVLYAEKGDNYQTLATTLDVSEEKAKEIINNGFFFEKGTDRWTVELTDEIKEVKAVKEAAVDYANRGWFGGNYNCYKSAIAIAKDKVPDSGDLGTRAYVLRLNQKTPEGEAMFNRVKTEKGEKPKWGDVASFSTPEPGSERNTPVHAATYLCTGKDGTKYFWTKNGSTTPLVMSQEQISKVYDYTKVNYYRYGGK
jgi:RHS repeat-associated protein